jgi:hypothetical protein
MTFLQKLWLFIQRLWRLSMVKVVGVGILSDGHIDVSFGC